LFFQDTLPEGATIVPILLGIDQTCVTVIGRKSCWPLYLSIGNLPKTVRSTYSRHPYVLIGYFPILEATGREADKPAFTEAKRILYQQCMRHILEYLDDAAQR
jgi:hypothetical protein